MKPAKLMVYYCPERDILEIWIKQRSRSPKPFARYYPYHGEHPHGTFWATYAPEFDGLILLGEL